MSLLCALPLAASLFSACAPAAPLAVGYVEGEYVLLAPLDTAQITDVAVRRGDRVEPGRQIAALDKGDAEIAVGQAEAALAQSLYDRMKQSKTNEAFFDSMKRN